MAALFQQLFELLSHVFYLFLHVTGGGAFPKALTAAQERQALEEMAQGSARARQKLIEHNLRLVAHIIKNRCCQGKDPLPKGAKTKKGKTRERVFPFLLG